MNSFHAKELAVEALKDEGIKAFERMGIISIPVESPEEIEPMVRTVKNIFKRIGYEGSWQVDPYYYEKHGPDAPIDAPEDPCS